MPDSDPDHIIPPGQTRPLGHKPKIRLSKAAQGRVGVLVEHAGTVNLRAGQLQEDVARVLATRQRGRAAPVAAASAAAPLGIPAEFVTTSGRRSEATATERGNETEAAPTAGAERRRAEAPNRLRRRYELQDTARRILRGVMWAGRPAPPPGYRRGQLVSVGRRTRYVPRLRQEPRRHRIHNCSCTPTGGLVAVNYHAEHGSASYGGLQTCGNMWVCPVCAAKIGARKAAEVKEGTDIWLSRGNHLYLMTLTLRHNAGMALYQSLGALKEAYRKMQAGRMWTLFTKRVGLVGSVVVREITHGASGWHPHLHVLFFTSDDMGSQRFVNEQWLARRWRKMLAELGFDATLEHGCDLRSADEEIPDYLAKLAGAWSVAAELAGQLHKEGRQGSRTPPQLLHDAGRARQIGQAAADHAGALYAEYAAATVGVNWMRWTPKLRGILGLLPEQSDEEIAAEQTEEATNLLVLTPGQWRFVQQKALRGELLAQACQGDPEYLAGWLMLQGLTIEREQLRYSYEPPEDT